MTDASRLREAYLNAPEFESVSPMSEPAQRPTFRALFEAEFAYVCRSLQRFGVNAEDVRDAAHDVFVAVHRHYESYDPTRPIRPWLFAFAVRVAAKHKEKARRHEARHDDEAMTEMIDESPGAEEHMAAIHARRLVLSALQHVEPERRAVLILHELDEQPIPDVASALGIPLNTAYSRLRLARADFRAALSRVRSLPSLGVQ